MVPAVPVQHRIGIVSVVGVSVITVNHRSKSLEHRDCLEDYVFFVTSNVIVLVRRPGAQRVWDLITRPGSRNYDLPDNDGNVSSVRSAAGLLSHKTWTNHSTFTASDFVGASHCGSNAKRFHQHFTYSDLLLIQVGIKFVIFKDSHVDPTQIRLRKYAFRGF